MDPVSVLIRECVNSEEVYSNIIFDEEENLSPSIIHTMYVYFRLNDPTALELYPDVSRLIQQNPQPITQEDIYNYRSIYTEVLPAFYKLLGLFHGTLYIASSNPTFKDIIIYKNQNRFATIQLKERLYPRILDVFFSISNQANYFGPMIYLMVNECLNS